MYNSASFSFACFTNHNTGGGCFPPVIRRFRFWNLVSRSLRQRPKAVWFSHPPPLWLPPEHHHPGHIHIWNRGSCKSFTLPFPPCGVRARPVFSLSWNIALIVRCPTAHPPVLYHISVAVFVYSSIVYFFLPLMLLHFIRSNSTFFTRAATNSPTVFFCFFLRYASFLLCLFYHPFQPSFFVGFFFSAVWKLHCAFAFAHLFNRKKREQKYAPQTLWWLFLYDSFYERK